MKEVYFIVCIVTTVAMLVSAIASVVFQFRALLGNESALPGTNKALAVAALSAVLFCGSAIAAVFVSKA